MDTAHHKHHHGKIAYLDNPQRNGGLTADNLLDLMPVGKSDSVLDFGAGTGFFTLPLARRTEKTVYALDIDPGMLELITAKAQTEQIDNITLLSGKLEEAKLDDGSLDVVFASLVLHEITPLAPVLETMNKLLKPGGHLIGIELEPKGAKNPKAPRLTLSDLEHALGAASFIVTDTSFPAESLYVLIARKDRDI
ncbi:class I SAM-dependent methyltransferase [Planococcus dechangensis]|uniref:Class I SAM-dependent methyltransferase n=1 Tax=Planococcus dechangensis TaxID=1176255 RepID=A0ABV9MFX7_9BACL